MSNTLPPRQFFGSLRHERSCAGYGVALRVATVPPEAIFEHAHEGAHFVLAIDSDYSSRALGNGVLAAPMTLIYNPPGTVHRDRFARPEGRFLSVDVPLSELPCVAHEARVVTSLPAQDAAARIAGMIASDDDDETMLEDLLLAVAGGACTPTSAGTPAWLAHAAQALADLAPERLVGVREVAAAAGVHPVHLARAYRRHFGCGPAEAMRRRRLARATGLLSRQSSLAEIAAEAGFADQSHMTRAFRRAYGSTPGQFRAGFA